MVHAHDIHGGISRRSRNDDPFGSTLKMSPSLLQDNEDTSGLHNIFGTSIILLDVDGISLLKVGDGPSIDDKLPILIFLPLNLPWVESYWNM